MISVGRPTEVTTEQGVSGIRVELVHALPGQVWSTSLFLPDGARAGDALVAARDWLAQIGADAGLGGLAVYGRAASADTVLRDGDRLEVLRPLSSDPKQSRRARAVLPPGAKKG